MTATNKIADDEEVQPRKKPRKPPVYVYQEMTYIGMLLWALGCVRMHADGSGFSCIYRPWHPVNWLLLLLLMPLCAVMGEKLLDIVPFRLSRFWRDNIGQLQWVLPWTRLDSVKPFNHHLSVRRKEDGSLDA